MIIGDNSDSCNSLCTLYKQTTSYEILGKFKKNCTDRHDPFEKYKWDLREICISPIQSLSVHMANVNSIYGLSPFIDYKKLWKDI